MKQYQRRWLEQQLSHNEARIQRLCGQYHVESLDQLTNEQYVHLSNRIFAAKKKAQQARASTSNTSHSTPPVQVMHQ